MRSVLALSFALLVSIASSASAQGAHTGGAHTGGAAVPPPRDLFAEQYTEASRAWHEGRYEDALARFRALYASSGRAELLYDIGVTADRLGRLEESIIAFEQYLASVPDARNRTEVEQRLASLRDDLREQQHVDVTPPPRETPRREDRPVMTPMGGEPAPPSEPSRSVVISDPTPPVDEVVDSGPSFVWTWPLLVLTVGAAIASPIVWVEGEGRRDELRDQCAITGCTRDFVSGELEGYEIATNALWISAASLGVLTAIVFFVEGSARTTVVRHAEREGVRLQVGLGGLALEGTF
ncbi:tetratricopeptide repeat protein [Sandaracinus amylolyticus]|uniref:tetratricopeptide repeat protein n=1 Tax=Sandaracinus amylolyticus TaxID=927083 RepID=UPI001F256B1F|nr:tetratricopeptide repeat protein [Sandaracinus amylolyticus]UJR82292.1 Hypothetical protein I5071_43570 [Sandaracinus amylolyticus]